MAIDDDHIENEIVTMRSVQSKRLRLLKKKLILAKALKSLRKLIMLSKLKGEPEEVGVRPGESEELYDEDYGGSSSTVNLTTGLHCSQFWGSQLTFLLATRSN